MLFRSNLDALRSEEGLRGEQVRLLEQRLAVGEIARPDVVRARIELSKLHLEIFAAEGQVSESNAALAASMAIPAAALQGIDFPWTELDSPPSAESLSPVVIQRDAVLNRLDVRRALAQYAAAEANLQLEISKQYPDIQIGPGYTYEEGHSFFTIGLSATLPVFNRNQPHRRSRGPPPGSSRRFPGEADAGDRRERNQPCRLYLGAQGTGRSRSLTANPRGCSIEIGRASCRERV